MPPAKQHLLESRALRDAARRVVSDDLAYVRSDAAKHGWARSVAQAGGDYFKLVAEGAADLAQTNRGKVAGGAALVLTALAAWAFRDQISDAVAGVLEDDEAPEPDAAPDITPTDTP